jgi:NAD-dependent SIR2 family protein deacetylase
LPDPDTIRDQTLSVAKQWIDEADAVLICAGAGMSVKEGEMVYVDQGDFTKHYPWFNQWA